MRKQSKARPSLVEAEGAWTLDELRVLSALAGSAIYKPVRKALELYRDQSKAALLDETVDFPATQFHRGRLRVIADFVQLLETEAPRKYEEARSKSAQKPSETAS